VITVTDANGCSVTKTVSVTQPSNALVATALPSTVACYGDTNGSIISNTSGGTAPYNFEWSNGAATAILSNIGAGSYTLTVTDANACTTIATATITQPAALNASITTSHVNCFGASNGSVNLTASGGTASYIYLWSNSSTLEDLQNIAAGTYSVTVTDSKNCSVTSQANVSQPTAALNASVATTEVSCYGGNNGGVNLTVNGGTTPYTYYWTDSSTSEDLQNIASGTYSVTITDFKSCSVTAQASVAQPLAALNTTATTSEVNCYGGSNGAVDLAISGGTLPYGYQWSNNAISEDLQNLPAGTYYVTVTDFKNCSVTTQASIAQPYMALSSSVETGLVNCFGGANGSVNLTIAGGTAPYYYLWNNNITSEDLQNLAAGVYTVTITDSKNCSVTSQASITQPSTALNVTLTSTNVNCYGNYTGSITAAVSGGTSPYSYLWSTGASVQNTSGIGAGNYTLTVNDANDCSVIKSVDVTQPTAALAVSISAVAVNCYGNTSGSVISSTVGGTAPYSFAWSTNAVTPNLSNATAGSYTLTVTDANSCTAVANTIVTQPSAGLNALVAAEAVNCYGGNNGSVGVSVSGGTTPYMYLWSNGSNAGSLQNVATGTYYVTVTDANGCSIVQQASVSQPIAPLSAITTPVSVSCFGGSNGGATVNASGGTTPYNFVWSNSQTLQSISNVVAGSYSVTVTDSKNCQATATVLIPQPSAALQIVSAKTDVSCYGSHDGEVNITPSGGTPPYSFEWNNNSAQQNQIGLLAGTYVVTATDVNGCSVMGTNQINQPAPLALATTQSNVLCYGDATGSAQVTVNGGTASYSYTWSNGKTTSNISNVPGGTYTVTVNDNNQCSASASLVVSQPSSGISASAYVKHVSCKAGSDGAVFLTINGGSLPYSYYWSNTALTQHVQNLTTGSYAVTITDANGCQNVLTNTVAEPTALTLSESHSSVKCYGGYNGAAQLITSGGTAPYTYHWSNGSNVSVSQNLIAGNYFVTVNDAHQCSATASFGITQPQPLTLSLNHTNALCFGSSTGAIQSNVSGGTPLYSYHWSNGSQDTGLIGVAAGNYTLTVTDGNGCSLAASRTIQQPTAIVVSEMHTIPQCFGSASADINLSVSGGNPAYTYSWSNGATSQDISNIVAGTYIVTVKDNSNCTVTKAIVVSEPAPVTLTETHATPSCNGYANGSITVNASGGTPSYQYFWSNGSNGQNINNLSAGSYGVTVVDAHGCGAALAAVLLTQPDSLNVLLTATDVRCSETSTGSIASSVAGGTQPYHFQWSNGSTSATIQNIEAGVYSLSVTDANGCPAINTAMVNDVPPLVVKGLGDSVACTGAKGNIVMWADGGVAPYLFQWSNGATTQNLNQITAGLYSVTVTDSNGCAVDTALEILNLNEFIVNASGGGTVTLGQAVELHAVSTGSTAVTYAWTPSQGVVCPACANTTSIPTRFTMYTVIAIDTNGCMAQDTVSADVIEDYTVFTPNAFTPNGDGNNDYFQFYGNAAGLKHINIMIFDRWGEKIYEADEPTFKWDGMYKGELVPPGVYVYVMKLVFINGHADKIHKGSLTVIR
jgi:gliding motility-associated-like protein